MSNVTNNNGIFTFSNLHADAKSMYNYYAFGSPKANTYDASLNTIAHDEWYDEPSNDYAYGFNSQKKEDEISGTGNHNTALFWEYDTRLGRRWNLDPIDQISITNYSCFKNNPVFNLDILGDKTIGLDEESAKESKISMDEILSSDASGGAKMKELIQIGSDGKTFQAIDQAKFDEAFASLKTDEVKALAIGYFKTINSDDNYYVLFGNEDKKLTSSLISDLPPGMQELVRDYSIKNLTTDQPKIGLGVSYNMKTSKSSLSIINKTGNEDKTKIFNHELIGHSLGTRFYFNIFKNIDEVTKKGSFSSIQVNNLYNCIHNCPFENGSNHNNGVPYDLTLISQRPEYLKE